MTDIATKAYESNLLKPEVHDRLVRDIENVAKGAGIPMSLIWTPLATNCGPEEVEYVRKLRHHASEGVAGFAYIGRKPAGPIATRMMAMAGAFLRNFVNARVMTVQEVLALSKDDKLPNPSVLLVPNFFIGKEQGGSIPAWQVSLLLGVLYNRQAEGLQTVLYIEDMDAMATQYGDVFKSHVMGSFVRVAA